MGGGTSWIGPAVVAAVISAIITAFGWYASHLSNRRLDLARRQERVQDVRTALRAEIRSHRQRLMLFKTASESGIGKLGDSIKGSPGFTPFVPREARPFVFEALIGDIHILPTRVIDPVIYYYAQIGAIAQFADDLRSDRYELLEPERKLAMYADYVAMGLYALDLADRAITAIENDQ